MKLESIKNRGVEIFGGARISNGSRIIDETLKKEPMKVTLGIHSVDEFNSSVYYYLDGEFKEIENKEQMDDIGNKYTFFFLRQVQTFLHYLWEVKDNNVYVRDGFLLVYDKRFEDGFTYKASLSEIYKLANGENSISLFTDDEIRLATQRFIIPEFIDFKEDSFGGRDVDSDHFYSKTSSRVERAVYFLSGARRSHTPPMKIVLYCNALECLFTSSKTEVTHKIAERVALMLGTTKDSRKQLFKLIKQGYNHRSTLVHGQAFDKRVKGEDLVEIALGFDGVLRHLVVDHYEIFSKDDGELEAFFTDLLFSN